MFKRPLALGLLYMISLPLAAAPVDSQAWQDSMMQQVPKFFCQPKSYFRQCFSITASACNEASNSLTQRCLKDLNIKSAQLTLEQSQRLGAELGTCVGQAFDKQFASQSISSDNCRNPSNWH